MKILLVGATGTLGRQIAKQAIEDGHEEDALSETQEKLPFYKSGDVN